MAKSTELEDMITRGCIQCIGEVWKVDNGAGLDLSRCHTELLDSENYGLFADQFMPIAMKVRKLDRQTGNMLIELVKLFTIKHSFDENVKQPDAIAETWDIPQEQAISASKPSVSKNRIVSHRPKTKVNLFEVEYKDPELIECDNGKDSTARKEYQGMSPVLAQLVLPDGSSLPNSTLNAPLGIGLKLTMTPKSQSPRIVLFVNFRDALGKSPFNQGKAIFPMNGTSERKNTITDFAISEGTFVDAVGVERPMIEMKFNTSGHMPNGLEEKWSGISLSTAQNDLSKFVVNVCGQLPICIRLLDSETHKNCRNAEIREHVQNFEQGLIEIRKAGDQNKGCFRAYVKERSGATGIQANAMLSLKEILNSMNHSFPIYPAFLTFVDLHTWAVVFGYGAENDRSYQDLPEAALRTLDHTCAITSLGNVFVIVVRFNQPRILNDRMPIKIKDGSTLKATIRSKDTGDDVSFTAVMHTQRFGLRSDPEFNFQCSVLDYALTEQDRSRLRAMMQGKFREKRLQLCHRVRFQPNVNMVDYRTQNNTITVMSSKTDRISKRFHLAMLLQDRLGMPVRSFCSLYGGDFNQKQFDETKCLVIKKGVKGKPLFDMQAKMLWYCDYYIGRMRVEHGGPGTGKTVMTILKGIVYLLNNVKVMIQAPTNYICFHDLKTMISHLEFHGLATHKKLVLWIHQRKFQASDWTVLNPSSDAESDNEDTEDDMGADYEHELFAYRQAHFNMKRDMGAEEFIIYTLIGHILRIAAEKKHSAMQKCPLWDQENEKFLSKSVAAKAGISNADDPEVDMFNEVHELAYKDKKTLSPHESARRRYALMACGDYVVELADVMIGTSTASVGKKYYKFGKYAPIVVFVNSVASS